MSRRMTHTAGRLAGAAALLAATTGAGVAALVSSAPAAGAQGGTTGLYSGSATGALVAVPSSSLLGTSLASLQVGPVLAEVNSGGLPPEPANTPPLPAGFESHANATNVNASVLGIALKNLLVVADQTAPPDNPTGVTKTFLPLTVPNLVTVNAGTAFAHARYINGDVCVPLNTPISEGKSQVANAAVLGNTTTGSVLGTTGPTGALNGEVTTDSTTMLVAGTASGAALQSKSSTDLSAISLLTGGGLLGTATGALGGIKIGVVNPPTITATATGVAGTASVTHSLPILTIQVGSATPTTLGGPGNPTSLTIPLVGTLSLGSFTSTVAANGTSASGSTSLLSLSLNVASLTGGTGLLSATIQVAPLTVSATVPVNGVQCPNLSGSNKTADQTTVTPGQTFHYTLNAVNSGPTTAKGAVAKDTLNQYVTFVSSSPTCTASGQNLTCPIGDVPPNSTKSLSLTVKVNSNAPVGTQLANTATFDITNGPPVTVSTPGPRVTGPPSAPPAPQAPPSAAAPSGTLPFTGEQPWIPVAGGGLLGAALIGLGLRRRMAHAKAS